MIFAFLYYRSMPLLSRGGRNESSLTFFSSRRGRLWGCKFWRRRGGAGSRGWTLDGCRAGALPHALLTCLATLMVGRGVLSVAVAAVAGVGDRLCTLHVSSAENITDRRRSQHRPSRGNGLLLAGCGTRLPDGCRRALLAASR